MYLDYNPEQPAALGQTLNIPIPSQLTNQVADIGTGSFTPINPTSTQVSLVFNQHPGLSYVVSDFSQFNTPSDIRRIFLDSALKGMLEYINNAIAALITPANFNVYGGGAIAGATGNYPVIADFTNAWSQLTAAKIPVRDFGNFFGITHPVAFAGMLSDTAWSANSQVGYQIAGETRRYAMLGEQFGALIDFDPAMPTTSTGSPAVVTYRTFVFHRHAIALGTRPLPDPNTSVVFSQNLLLKDIIPVRVQLGYNQLQNGWVTTLEAGYALGVVRPDHGIIITNHA